jgi:hypothetical protein
MKIPSGTKLTLIGAVPLTILVCFLTLVGYYFLKDFGCNNRDFFLSSYDECMGTPLLWFGTGFFIVLLVSFVCAFLCGVSYALGRAFFYMLGAK